ncbi:VOC family protein [Chitinimonas naiadis]
MPKPFPAGAVIYAKDLASVRDFYVAVTDLKLVRLEPDYALLENATYQLVIHAIPPVYAADITIDNPPKRREDTAIKLIFLVNSIAAARRLALQHGGIVDPKQQEWQFQRYLVCDGHDPEGNVIQLREWLTAMVE